MTGEEQTYPPTEYKWKSCDPQLLKEMGVNVKHDSDYRYIPNTKIFFNINHNDNENGMQVFTDPNPTKKMWIDALEHNPNCAEFIPDELYKDMDVFSHIMAYTNNIRWNGIITKSQVEIIKTSSKHLTHVLNRWYDDYFNVFICADCEIEFLEKIWEKLSLNEKNRILNIPNIENEIKKSKILILHLIEFRGLNAKIKIDFYDVELINNLLEKIGKNEIKILNLFDLNEEDMNKLISHLIWNEFIKIDDIPLKYVNRALLKKLNHPLYTEEDNRVELANKIAQIIAILQD